eukprot:CAMPEP_0197036666 /NCGR_PEP_ID=MMETSP1384-20130603/14111_1 /TAXON_ID=29189 /ORGANISM="Ammonia sp." /LENGTH=770 /DNA_ID=CAMNT_0042466865 /DNA_START=983 /DNA_END=3295 /DNA_ORIENTATION=-
MSIKGLRIIKPNAKNDLTRLSPVPSNKVTDDDTLPPHTNGTTQLPPVSTGGAAAIFSPRHSINVMNTPVWDTFESMQFDYDDDELSEDDEYPVLPVNNEDNETLFSDDNETVCTYDSIDDHDDMRTPELTASPAAFDIHPALLSIDEKKEDAESVDRDSFLAPSQIAKIRKSLTSKRKGKLKMTNRMSMPAAALSANLRQFQPAVANQPHRSTQTTLQLPNLNEIEEELDDVSPIEDTTPMGRPRTNSLPLAKVKHYQVEGLTIWSNHQKELENLYEKWRGSRSNRKAQRIERKKKTQKQLDKLKVIKDTEVVGDEVLNLKTPQDFGSATDNDDDADYYDDMKLGLDQDQYSEPREDSMVSTLSEQEENIRKFLINEIIHTEETYVNGLRTLLYEFVEPMFEQKMIKKRYRETLVCNIPQLLQFHTQFLEHMIDATGTLIFDLMSPDEPEEAEAFAQGMSSNPMFNQTAQPAAPSSFKSLVAVFYELCNDQFVEMYAMYTLEYQDMLDVYAKYNKNKKVQKYLKNKRKEKKPLSNHLILPIQRVTRYQLLLGELHKNTPTTHDDYDELESVMQKIEETVNKINEKQREIENMSQCLQIQETMNGLNKNIVAPNRCFLAQFLFRKKDNKRGRQFFLFNDLLIITNLKLKVKIMMDLPQISVKKSKKNQLEFKLAAKEPKHEAVYSTDLEKLDDIARLIQLIDDHQRRARMKHARRGQTSLSKKDFARVLKKSKSVTQSKMFGKKHIDVDELQRALSASSVEPIEEEGSLFD